MFTKNAIWLLSVSKIYRSHSLCLLILRLLSTKVQDIVFHICYACLTLPTFHKDRTWKDYLECGRCYRCYSLDSYMPIQSQEKLSTAKVLREKYNLFGHTSASPHLSHFGRWLVQTYLPCSKNQWWEMVWTQKDTRSNFVEEGNYSRNHIKVLNIILFILEMM